MGWEVGRPGPGRGGGGRGGLTLLRGSHIPRFRSLLHLVHQLGNPVTGEILVDALLSVYNLGWGACLQPHVLRGWHSQDLWV